MRARLYPVGKHDAVQIVWIDAFPAIISKDVQGHIRFDSPAEGNAMCLIDEYQGNLIIKDCAANRTVTVNGMPIIRGGLLPGDTLTVGSESFVVSYERTTSRSPLSATYHLAQGIHVE